MPTVEAGRTTILLVEDSRTQGLQAQGVLENGNYDVVHRADGRARGTGHGDDPSAGRRIVAGGA